MNGYLSPDSSRPDLIGSTVSVYTEDGSDGIEKMSSTLSTGAPVRADASALQSESTSPVTPEDDGKGSYKRESDLHRAGEYLLGDWRLQTFYCFCNAFLAIVSEVKSPVSMTIFGLYMTYTILCIMVLASSVSLSLLVHAELCAFRCRTIPALRNARIARMPLDCFSTATVATCILYLVGRLCEQTSEPKAITLGELALFALCAVLIVVMYKRIYIRVPDTVYAEHGPGGAPHLGSCDVRGREEGKKDLEKDSVTV